MSRYIVWHRRHLVHAHCELHRGKNRASAANMHEMHCRKQAKQWVVQCVSWHIVQCRRCDMLVNSTLRGRPRRAVAAIVHKVSSWIRSQERILHAVQSQRVQQRHNRLHRARALSAGSTKQTNVHNLHCRTRSRHIRPVHAMPRNFIWYKRQDMHTNPALQGRPRRAVPAIVHQVPSRIRSQKWILRGVQRQHIQHRRQGMQTES